MRFFFILLLTGIASYFALLVMPWWIPMLIACCLCLAWPTKHWQAFLAAGIGAALSYCLMSLVQDMHNEHILSRKMARLFGLPSYIFMIALTTLTGFITAGLGGWTGAALNHLFRGKKIPEEGTAGEQSNP